MLEDPTNEPGWTPFQHTPSDLSSSSIRLVEILPCSPPNPIRCKIKHATIDDDYACLSYVWGSADDLCTILIDEQPFHVRRNLWNFLELLSTGEMNDYATATSSSSGPCDQDEDYQPWPLFWIDAISVDQGNVRERNHQVQHMGRIFRGAQHVLGWLGDEPEIDALFQSIKIYQKRQDVEFLLRPTFEDAVDHICTPSERIQFAEKFVKSEYWQRAWITQEIITARRFYFLAGSELLDVEYIDQNVQKTLVKYVKSWHRVFWQPALTRREVPKQYSLMENLWQFQFKKCFEARDRIYSLLAISRHGADFVVDYDTFIVEVALSIFRHDPEFCLCHANMVFRSLQLMGTSLPIPDTRPFAQITAAAVDQGQRVCNACKHSFGVETAVVDDLDHMYIEKYYVHCLSCDHSAVALVPQHSLHGHLIIARERCREGTADSGVRWWVVIQKPGYGIEWVNKAGWFDWREDGKNVNDSDYSDGDKHVTVQLSVQTVHTMATVASGFGWEGAASMYILDNDDRLQLSRVDPETEWNQRWTFL